MSLGVKGCRSPGVHEVQGSRCQLESKGAQSSGLGICGSRSLGVQESRESRGRIVSWSPGGNKPTTISESDGKELVEHRMLRNQSEGGEGCDIVQGVACAPSTKLQLTVIPTT